MKRLVKWLVGAGLAAFLLAGTGGTSEAKMMGSPWMPEFSSPANFYDIQVDQETAAQDVVKAIHQRQEQTWPDAADHAGPKK